jgi:hypothetical protein
MNPHALRLPLNILTKDASAIARESWSAGKGMPQDVELVAQGKNLNLEVTPYW